MIVFNSPELGLKVVRAAHVTDFNHERDVSITRIGKAGLLGGVVFQEYTGSSVNIHVAGFVPHWMNRELLWHVFNFAFVSLQCKKVIGKVHSGNLKALKMDVHLGFQVEAVIKDVFRDGDLMVLSMYRDDCKWLKLERPLARVLDGKDLDGKIST